MGIEQLTLCIGFASKCGDQGGLAGVFEVNDIFIQNAKGLFDVFSNSGGIGIGRVDVWNVASSFIIRIANDHRNVVGAGSGFGKFYHNWVGGEWGYWFGFC